MVPGIVCLPVRERVVTCLLRQAQLWGLCFFFFLLFSILCLSSSPRYNSYLLSLALSLGGSSPSDSPGMRPEEGPLLGRLVVAGAKGGKISALKATDGGEAPATRRTGGKMTVKHI